MPAAPDAPLAAVVLAAGAGRRFGHRPKCLLTRGGEPLIARQLRLLHETGVAHVAVALGHHAGRIAPVLAALQARGSPHVPAHLCVAVNPAPDAGGVASSLRCALAALPADVGGVMVLLADQPLLTPGDLLTMQHVWHARAPAVQLVLPTHAGQPGHPLVLGPLVRSAVMQGRAVRDWRRTHPAQVQALALDHPRCTLDVDDEAARQQLAAQHGVALHWPAELVG
ncbi:MAG: NTP transferase domain-containing protein [Pseudomonadota bacterium]|nr:NTP transferase domain-containing protein [Pseudomonadota bacterium]